MSRDFECENTKQSNQIEAIMATHSDDEVYQEENVEGKIYQQQRRRRPPNTTLQVRPTENTR